MVVGPLLTGLNKPVQIASMNATASDIVNLAAITAFDING
jgi:malate dehydrogenase (oxaloacetate-decarboxylating)(NADP+)